MDTKNENSEDERTLRQTSIKLFAFPVNGVYSEQIVEYNVGRGGHIEVAYISRGLTTLGNSRYHWPD